MGAAFNERDVNDDWRAKLDPDAYRETTKDLYTLGNIINQGFSESWGDFNQWNQGLVGGITGACKLYIISFYSSAISDLKSYIIKTSVGCLKIIGY